MVRCCCSSYVLLLRFSGFHTNPPDFQHRFERLGIPGPERLLDVLPDRVPGFRISFPAQLDLKQVTDFILGKHQEGVGQVQTDSSIMAGQRTISQVNSAAQK